MTQLSMILDWFGRPLQYLVCRLDLELPCMKQFKWTQLHFGLNSGHFFILSGGIMAVNAHIFFFHINLS